MAEYNFSVVAACDPCSECASGSSGASGSSSSSSSSYTSSSGPYGDWVCITDWTATYDCVTDAWTLSQDGDPTCIQESELGPTNTWEDTADPLIKTQRVQGVTAYADPGDCGAACDVLEPTGPPIVTPECPSSYSSSSSSGSSSSGACTPDCIVFTVTGSMISPPPNGTRTLFITGESLGTPCPYRWENEIRCWFDPPPGFYYGESLRKIFVPTSDASDSSGAGTYYWELSLGGPCTFRAPATAYGCCPPLTGWELYYYIGWDYPEIDPGTPVLSSIRFGDASGSSSGDNCPENNSGDNCPPTP